MGKLKRVTTSPLNILGGAVLAFFIYIFLEPHIVSDGPIFVYHTNPYVTNEKGVREPHVKPGDILIAHFHGKVRRTCEKVSYLRWFIRMEGDFQRVVKTPPRQATNVNPGVYKVQVTQVVPTELRLGKWVWRSIELAECYRGYVWRSHRDMPFTVSE
jgi:hypothetical protein